MTIPEYHPVPGELYDTYELAILRHQWLRLGWRAPHGEHRVEAVLPIDLRTRQRAEYLVVEDLLGRRRFLRLDRIVGASAFFMHRPETGTH
ncbi:MAG: transcriptional antiterminator, Rof [Halofilum sp. (in: g-proteobacteria)]|nr:transcriptional antiterminator, Rof [Halofilum sp. (in: g-proteobacteria)]